MSKGAQLENSSLEWLLQLDAIEAGSVRRTNRVLAVGAQRVLGDLNGAYKKLQDSQGSSNRYVAQQAAARLAAIGDLLPPKQRSALVEAQKRDLARAQDTGGKAGVDLARITKEGSLTLKENAKPNTLAINNAGKRLNDFWAKENQTFRDRVTALTQVALAEGKSYRNLAAQVRSLLVLEQQQGTESARSTRVNARMGISQRAEVIARTEMQTAFVQGQIANYRQLGYEWARWSAAAERSCGYCMSRDGLIFQMEEIEGSIPAHPRCRCTLIPVEKPAGLGNKKPSQLQADEFLDDAYWRKSRKNKLDEWKKDQNKTKSGKPKERLQSNSDLDKALRRYERTPTNQQEYLRPGSDAPPAKWKPGNDTIPDLAKAQKAALAEQQALVKAQKRALNQDKAQVVKKRPGETETFKKHSNANGAEPGPDTVWTPERQKLHADILDHFLKDGVVSKNPTFTMSGGGPASGKGFMLKKTGLDQPGKVVLDADEIKKLIPEYAAAQKKGGKAQQKAASQVHEESSYLAKKLMAEAANRGYDVVLDGTGDNGLKSLKKKVDAMRAKGYRVEAKYVSADTDLAAQRNWDRFLKTGRLPPEHMLRNVHRDVSKTLPEAIETDLFDRVELYDTNKSGELRPVISKTQGQKATIHDKRLWDDFLKKGEAEVWTSERGDAAIRQRKLKEQPKAADTAQRHSDARGKGVEPGPDTVWTTERAKLHDDIVAHFLKNGKVSDNPTFTMSGGGPASGKGFMLKKTGLDQPGKVVIDADEIKKLIPEYGEMQKAGGKKALKAAAYVHEESSYLAKRIMGEAADAGFDVVLDGTGDNGVKSLKKKVDKMREKGYRVEAKYVSADTEVAVQRNWDRFLKTGRLPPEHMLRNVHRDVSRTLPDAMDQGLFDKVELYDTNKSGELRLVASQDAGRKPKIHDPKLWDDFKRKGDADVVSEADVKRLQEARQLKEWKSASDTLARHSNARSKGAEPGPETVWTRERAKLHDDIVESFLAKGKVSADPTFTMSGGGPASGKGFMLKKTGLDQPGKVVVDSDEIKKLLPEYREMQKAGGAKAKKAAGYVHEESSYLAKRIMDAAADRGFDVVLDGTGDNGLKSLAKKVDKMRAKGYKVEAKYVSADTEVAAQRNWERFLKTGRLPPESMLRNVHRDVSRTLPDAIDADLFDRVELYDTNKTGELRKVISKTKGQKTTVHDDALWNRFLQKADAETFTPADDARLIKAQEQRMPTLDAKPAAPKAAVKPKAPAPAPERELTEMLGRSGRVDTDLVKADPERFQYKVNANKTTGEVGSLKGANKWNEELAGVMSVWRDPANDQLYVINGHNRLALAKRMGVKEIPVLQIKAKTAAEARMIGAKQNIASGDGTAIDAAKFMRDSGLKAADLQRVGMNLKAKVARDGAALANLPDHVFRAAVEGRLPLDKAVALGRSGLEPAQMADAYKILKDRPTMPTAQVDALMAAARASTTRTKREQTLFGETAEQVTTMVEQAKVAANVKADLKKQVSVLEKAARNAEALKAKGNRIDVNKAELKAANARAQLDVFDAQVFRPGSKVNQALTKGAAAVQDASGRGGVQKASKAAKDSVLDALASEVKTMQKQPGGVLRGVADLNAAEAGRRAKPPELEALAGKPDLTAADIPARLIDPAKAKAGTMGSLRPDQIQVDADRFQYKATTEKSGEVGSLEGVQRFDRNLAGVISVWKDPANGQTYVINGHNRLAAAKRLGADAVEVRYINAKDASEARSVGAMANIAEGHGTAIDAAKWMRETGLGGDGLRGLGMAMKKDVAVQGAALSNLPDDLWQQVVNEQISPEKAAEIGGGGLDAQGMANVAKVLKHRPNASVETVRELVAAEKASMEMGTTGSLFGEDSAAYQMERAQLTRDMRRDILSDKQLFNTLASNRAKAELESAGSTLDVDANARAAAEQDAVLSVYDQLKNSSGPVADALSRGARAMEGAKSAADKLRIRKRVRDEIGDAVREELQGLVPGQTEAPPEAPGQESLF